MTEQNASGEAVVGTILVGCGNRGVHAHGRLAQQLPTFELVAVCDVDEARLRAASEHLGVPGERDLDRLLTRHGVQAVIVATGVPWHVPVALAAIRAGKHVLVEKPLADTTAAARELVQAAERAGVMGLVGYQWRLSEFTAALVREAAALAPLQALVTRQ